MKCKGMIFYSPRQIITHTFLFCKRKSLFCSTLMQKNVARDSLITQDYS